MSTDVVIVGAGQAGLAAAWHARRAGLAVRLLEASDRPGGAWRHYYDSLVLFSPARYSALPGLPFPGPLDHYPARDEVVDYLESYARMLDVTVETGQRVVALETASAGMAVHTQAGAAISTRAVIVASGAFGSPHVPAIPGLERFEGEVLHSGAYRSPAAFAGKRVVVIGGANSAVQIAHELARVADVTLASRRAIRFVPQRLLGKDFHFWLRVTGLDHTRWLDDQSTPVLDDGTYRRAIGAGCPPCRPMFRRVHARGIEWSDGRIEPADVLLFATGFRPSVPFLAGLGAIDGNGKLLQRDGIATRVPGLYFAGFPKQRNFASATLRGVGPDAQAVVRHMLRSQGRAGETRRVASPSSTGGLHPPYTTRSR